MITNHYLRFSLFVMMNGMLLLLINSFALKAQAGLGIAGGHATSDELSFSYSVGQVFNEALNQSGYYVSQGIQHPSLLVINDAPHVEDIEVQMNIYPNPSEDELHIDLHNDEFTICKLQLMNLHGQVLVEKTFESNEYVLSLGAYDAGHYLLRIAPDNSECRTFKIIKTK